MKKQYNSLITYALKGTIYLFFIMVILMTFLILIAVKLDMGSSIVGFSLTLLFISPFLFEKKIKDFFTKRVFLKFDSQAFSITLCNLKSDNGMKEMVYKWDELKAYKFYFTSRKFTYMDIYLKNGTHRKFGFKDNKTEEESIKQESVFSLFRSFVKQYNSDKEPDQEINLKAGFLTTKIGTLLLWGICLLILIAIIIHIVKDIKSFPFLLIGVCAVIPLILKRKQEKSLYEKLSNLD